MISTLCLHLDPKNKFKVFLVGAFKVCLKKYTNFSNSMNSIQFSKIKKILKANQYLRKKLRFVI